MTDARPVARQLTSASLAGIAQDGVAVPSYARDDVRVGIVHFGVGGFHRAHEAMYLDRLMNDGLALDWGICGVGLQPADRRMSEVMQAQDCLYTLVVKDPDGSTSARVVGSIVEYLYAPDEPAEVFDAMCSPDVHIVSMTVTEAGYNVHRVTGDFDADGPNIAHDLAHPGTPRTVFGFVVEALARRRMAGLPPFAVVSCDNVQGNGEVTQHAVVGYAMLRDAELAHWISREVRFPNSMVDRITPATTDDDRALVRDRFGIADDWPVVCEPFTQWVLEDALDPRPPLERAGVQVVPDVEPYELMKLRLLNASHQALGYAGYLAGYRLVHEATADPSFATLLRNYMRCEAIPSLRPVPGVDLDAYVDELIVRFGNPEVRDTLARLCVDSSERIPKFLLPVVRHQLAEDGPIDLSVFVIAAWARYCEGSDESGAAIDIVDPATDSLTAAASGQRDDRLAFVRNRDIFGDLADDERFAASYRRSLDSLLSVGSAATVEHLARTGSWDARG